MKTYFSTHPSFRQVKTYFLSRGNSMLFLELFFWCSKPWLKLGESILTEKSFFASGNYFWFFLLEEAVFPYNGDVFFNECFINGMNTASVNHKLFFRLVETNTSFQLLEKDFIFLESSFLLQATTFTYVSGNHSLKTDLILASGDSFSG